MAIAPIVIRVARHTAASGRAQVYKTGQPTTPVHTSQTPRNQGTEPWKNSEQQKQAQTQQTRMTVASTPMSVSRLPAPPHSSVDFGAIIENANIENMTGK